MFQPKQYLQMNIHQKINTKFFANIYRTKFIGDNTNVYVFIMSQFDGIDTKCYSSIPYVSPYLGRKTKQSYKIITNLSIIC